MRRIHWFEFGDQPWVPRFLRRYLHELLAYQVGSIYAPVVPLLNRWIAEHNLQHMVDLASGAGGPWPALLPALDRPPQLTYTDQHPQQGPHWHPQSVDLLSPNTWPDSGGFSLFTGLHHLRPQQVRDLFAAVASRQQPLFVAEFTERKPRQILGMLLSPILVWVHTLQVRPRRLLRFLFTYLVPVVPLLYLWDGAVSHARSYTSEELAAMAEEVGLAVKIEEVCHEGMRVLVLRT